MQLPAPAQGGGDRAAVAPTPAGAMQLPAQPYGVMPESGGGSDAASRCKLRAQSAEAARLTDGACRSSKADGLNGWPARVCYCVWAAARPAQDALRLPQPHVSVLPNSLRGQQVFRIRRYAAASHSMRKRCYRQLKTDGILGATKAKEYSVTGNRTPVWSDQINESDRC